MLSNSSARLKHRPQQQAAMTTNIPSTRSEAACDSHHWCRNLNRSCINHNHGKSKLHTDTTMLCHGDCFMTQAGYKHCEVKVINTYMSVHNESTSTCTYHAACAYARWQAVQQPVHLALHSTTTHQTTMHHAVVTAEGCFNSQLLEYPTTLHSVQQNARAPIMCHGAL